MIYLDTETCGFYGLPILIQYAENDEPPKIHDIWKLPAKDTLRLIEKICMDRDGVIMFNSTFDWFHINKIYNCLRLVNPDEVPTPEAVALIEVQARDGVCVKPLHTLDLFLFARKGPYQSLMERGDIAIRRVPDAIAAGLAVELSQRVPLNPIYFARREDKTYSWSLRQSEDYETKEPLRGMFDVVLKFAPTSALKALAVDALKLQNVAIFADISVDKAFMPNEKGYKPYGDWAPVIKYHINHWSNNKFAREYSLNDVVYLQKLYKHFGCPPMDDDDSVLACKVAADRWKGFALDIPKLKDLLEKSKKAKTTIPTAPRQVLAWISEVMSPDERKMVVKTDKNTLAEVANWRVLAPNYVCDKPEAHSGKYGACEDLHDAPTAVHPAAERAKRVIAARSLEKEIELYEKLIDAGRFHPSFKIIGALSGRMSGADGLNPQGIKRAKYVRACFPLHFENEILSGGDFKSFEVSLAEAEYKDPKLRADLLGGLKVHGIFGTFLFPDVTYEEILESEGGEDDKYTKSKSGFFALIYGGDQNTIHKKQGIPLPTAEQALEMFEKKYTEVKKARQKVFYAFCSMVQPVPGGPVKWREPSEFVESMLGFKRYFTLENRICKALFDLAQNPPKEWKEIKGAVKRRERLQTNAGATQSALFGAAFGIQSSNMRAAANHRIQSTGAQITKRVQVKINELQPAGCHPWVVRTLNIHDEINTVSTVQVADEIERVVKETVASFVPLVPLIRIDWKKGMESWAAK